MLRRLFRDEGYAYRLVLPAMAIELVFVALPLAVAVYYSIHRVRFFQIGSYVDWQNYLFILTSDLVINSFLVTAVFTGFSLALTFAIGFGLALHLNSDSRANIALRAVVLVPYVIAMLVGSLLLKWMYAQDSGILELALGPLGLGHISILADPTLAMAALVSNAIWRDSAFAMILLMAGLKAIDPQLHAAARVDGASAWYRFRRITLPLLRIPILITLIRLLLHFMNILTFPLVLTGGGPLKATETIGLRTYALGFLDFDLGRANALALIVFAVNMMLVLVLVRLFQKRGRL
jgi:multiple sugar transport system permease protein